MTKKTARAAALLTITAVLAAAGALAILQSGWFKNKVREKLIAVVEGATGGRVEIGSFSYDWRHLTASVAPFVLHGKEPAGQPPLFRAERIQVVLRVISLMERRVDLESLTMEKPQWAITVDSDGRSNLPKPRNVETVVRELLDIKIRRLDLKNGTAQYNSFRTVFDLSARNFGADLHFDSRGPAYTGRIEAGSVRVNPAGGEDDEFGFVAPVTLQKSGLRIEEATLTRGQSHIQISGLIEHLAAPSGVLEIGADVKPADFAAAHLQLPVANTGSVAFDGSLQFALEPSLTWTLAGKVAGRGLGVKNGYANIVNAGLSGTIKATPGGLEIPQFTLNALGGSFQGRLDLSGWKKWSLSGDARNISVRELALARNAGITDLNGVVSGPVQAQGAISASGTQGLRAQAKLNLKPGSSGVPLQGFLDLNYDQASNLISLGDSTLTLGSSRVDVSGVLGEMLKVHAESRNLNDMRSALALVGEKLEKEIPVALKSGVARFDGAIAGPLRDPRVSGQIELTKFTVHDQDVDGLTGTFDLTNSGLAVKTLKLSQDGAQLQAAGRLGLSNWRWSNASPISASVSVQGADVTRILTQFQSKIPVSGALAATAGIKGTVGSPIVASELRSDHIIAYGEGFDRVRAQWTVSGNTIELLSATATAASGEVNARGSFTHAPADWSTGALTFDAAARGLAVAQIKKLQEFRAGSAGQADLSARGSARLNKSAFRIESVTSEASLRNVSLDGHAYGSLTVSANSHEEALSVKLTANLLGTPVQGSGEWKLEGDDPGHGEISIPHVTVEALHELVPNPVRDHLPFDGYAEGLATIDGPLRKPDQMRAEVRLSALQLNASAGAKPRAGAQARDLVLRSSKPLLFTATTKGIVIRSAQLTGTDTTIEAAGGLAFDAKSPWDLRLNGTVNLAILQIFNPDLLGSGISVVNAAIHGPLADPQVEGRLEVKNASLYLADLPNGLDQANGLFVFDRNRATVDSLTAVTGGGRVTIQKGSFVGFRGSVLLYRVQASADNVRYRSPEGVSLTVNGALSLVGTSESSVLSGAVTVMRVGFNPTTDVGSLLATTARPVSSPSTPNQYLKGIQFDVRVESAQSLEIQTSLTRNVEAEANLRLRGSPERPIVLGTITVTDGQIEFFGNRYHINRGEINFYNTAKIDPVIDMDLETTVRGITVDISFSGALNKLNFSYRSDPPLQPNDIIALLAVGRAPSSSNTVASTEANTNTNYLSTGSNNLLAQAISAPNEGRLQRFFGVSHIKIDPQLSDITSVPQARLSFEQQISRDITLTYITNVTRTQEQILRVELNLTGRWSVVALRDENGEFGIDFQYRRRFK